MDKEDRKIFVNTIGEIGVSYAIMFSISVIKLGASYLLGNFITGGFGENFMYQGLSTLIGLFVLLFLLTMCGVLWFVFMWINEIDKTD